MTDNASAEWRKTTLGDAAVLSAKTVSPSELGDVPYIGLEHIAPDALRLSGNGAASDVVSAKTSFQKGDVLFGKLRPYFRKVALAPFDGICSTDIWVVKPAKGVDARFLFYVMANQDFVDMAARESVGTRMPRAKWEYAARYEFRLPPISAQRRVSAALGALDDKIELNARMNETLDETARALFRAWFVDFVPVRAKMSGAWRRGESPPGLPAALYDAFPDAMADSALGEIPAGWEVGEVGDFFDLNMGQSPPGDTYNENGDGLPFFQGRADFDFRYPNNRRYCVAPKRVAKADDTLVSVRAPVGTTNMAWERCCIGRGLAALRHKSGSASFTYYALEAMQDEIQRYEDNGTVFGSIGKRQFAALPALEPPSAAIAAFGEYAAECDSRIRANTAESRALARHS